VRGDVVALGYSHASLPEISCSPRSNQPCRPADFTSIHHSFAFAARGLATL
jgi:hypothetical protein